MSDNEPIACAIVLFVVIGFPLGLLIRGCGVADGVGYEQAKAIEAGVGRWQIDAKTGAREFVYGVPREGK